MVSIKNALVSTTHKVILGAQVIAATVQPQQQLEPAKGDDRFDKDIPKTTVMATPRADTSAAGKVGDGKTISWLDAISMNRRGHARSDDAPSATKPEAAVSSSSLTAVDSVVRQDLTALGKVRLVKNADSSLSILDVPAHLAQGDNLRVMGSWSTSSATAVVTTSRREVMHTDVKAPTAMVVDKQALAATGALKVKLPMAFANDALPDVVSLTIYKADGNGYLLPLSTSGSDSLDVPDPIGAIRQAQKQSPVFSLDSLRVSDVRQGAVGSCYFLASAGALISRDQSIADRAVAVDGNRMWVKFQQPTDATRHVWVLSDADQNQGAQARRLPSAPQSKDSLDVMWPVVMEKAWMTMSRSHDYRLETGGAPETALNALGVPTIVRAVDRYTDAALLARIDGGNVYVASSKLLLPADQQQALMGKGLVPRHAYTVLGADVTKGEVQLYNPWGMKLSVKVADFRAAFENFTEKRELLPSEQYALDHPAPTGG